MRQLGLSIFAMLVLVSYIVIYTVLKWLTKILAVVSYVLCRAFDSSLSWKDFVEKRDEVIRSIKRADEKIWEWANEGNENMILLLFICSSLSIAGVGWVVLQLWRYTQ